MVQEEVHELHTVWSVGRCDIPCPLLEACAASRQDELGAVLLGKQSPPGVLALSSQLGKLNQVVELLVHILGTTHQLQVLSGLHNTWQLYNKLCDAIARIVLEQELGDQHGRLQILQAGHTQSQ